MKSYHPSTIVDILNKVSNLIRHGVVEAITGDRVRVRSGNVLTTFIPWLTTRAGDARTWWAPSVGEQVLLLCPDGNLSLAVALPAIYSNRFSAPATNSNAVVTHFPDGAEFMYQPDSSTLNISGIQHITIQAAGAVNVTASDAITLSSSNKIMLDAPLVQCSAHFSAATFSMTGGAGSGATGTINGDINHSGRLTSNGVTLSDHVHSGVQTGSGTTGKPK